MRWSSYQESGRAGRKVYILIFISTNPSFFPTFSLASQKCNKNHIIRTHGARLHTLHDTVCTIDRGSLSLFLASCAPRFELGILRCILHLGSCRNPVSGNERPYCARRRWGKLGSRYCKISWSFFFFFSHRYYAVLVAKPFCLCLKHLVSRQAGKQ